MVEVGADGQPCLALLAETDEDRPSRCLGWTMSNRQYRIEVGDV
jgi:hypothetical protein